MAGELLDGIGKVGKGAASGAKLGMKAGPEGAAVGAAIGGVLSGIQAISAYNQGKKADAAMPELVDPLQSSYLAELNQKKKSIETGADFAEGIRAADTSQAGTNDAIVSAGGGDSGGTMQALLQAQRVAGDTKNRVIAQGQQQAANYEGFYGGMLNQIAGRKLQLEMYNQDRLRAQQAAKQQGANDNFMASLGRLASGNNGLPAAGAGTETAPAGLNSLLGKPDIGNTMMGGVGAETVVPESTLAIQGLGSLMNLAPAAL